MRRQPTRKKEKTMRMGDMTFGQLDPGPTVARDRNWPAVRPAERMMKNQLRAQIGGLYAGAGLDNPERHPEMPTRIIQFFV